MFGQRVALTRAGFENSLSLKVVLTNHRPDQLGGCGIKVLIEHVVNVFVAICLRRLMLPDPVWEPYKGKQIA